MPSNPVPTNAPKSKVMAATMGAGVGSALVVILVWLLQNAGIMLPDRVTDALSVVVTALLGFASGWVTPPGAGETNIIQNDGTVRSASIPAPLPAGALPQRG
jgi:hypothetical protein